MHVNHVFACCLLLAEQSLAAGALVETSPQAYPFHAVVDSIFVCSALLISQDYVLCPAHCVNGTTWGAKVFLGYNSDAFFQARLWEKDTEASHSRNIIIHEKFLQVSNSTFVNNIALVKLDRSVAMRDTILPGVLMAKEEVQLLGDALVNVTGWSTDVVSNLSLTQGRLLNGDYCNLLYQPTFFPNQETCLEWLNKDNRLSLSGNIVSINYKVLGFTIRPPCLSGETTCIAHNKVITIAPFLDWIVRHTNISLLDLTTYKSQEVDLIERLDNIVWMLQEVDDEHFKNSRRLRRMEYTMKRLMDTLRDIKTAIEDNCSVFIEP